MPTTGRRGFTLAELLVVVGIISLLIAIILPSLQIAREKAMQAKCSAQLQQLGLALEGGFTEYGFYPLWDDGGDTVRYTWIDVLIQKQLVSPARDNDNDRPRRPAAHIGYCPADRLPDALNTARHTNLIYPRRHTRSGIDYSYGIGVPLSAGGWAWRAAADPDHGRRPRRFRGYQRNTAGRVLAGDAFSAAVYNLSADALRSGVWNDPTQFDNTVAWGRHHTSSADFATANLLYQDGHVSAARYYFSRANPVNTSQAFVWHPGEPINVGPEDSYDGQWYPCQPPPNCMSTPPGETFPAELTPTWYTRSHRWTRISHK